MTSPIMNEYRPRSWLQVVRPETVHRLGKIRHVLFDFDGTLSLLRQGWEKVMVALMLEAISAGGKGGNEIAGEVQEYVDRSTGILTIRQMEWLAETVRSYGGKALSPAEYKARYLACLMDNIRERIASLELGQGDPDALMVSGARAFVAGLHRQGTMLYLASGTDQADVQHEARLLEIADYFAGAIYGALDATEANNKERIIQRILDEHYLAGNELLVVGDGPVEIREAVLRNALTLGVASDEVKRQGWNSRKVERLSNAGCDFLVADFSYAQELLAFLFPQNSEG